MPTPKELLSIARRTSFAFAVSELEEYLTEKTREGLAENPDGDGVASDVLQGVIDRVQDSLFTAFWETCPSPSEEGHEARTKALLGAVNRDVVADNASDRFADDCSYRRNPNAYFGVSDKDF